MTVTTTATYSELVGNGSATAFPFTFAAASANEVQVSIGGVMQGGGYSVALSSSGTGGTVTFDTAPANAAAVLIQSDPDFTQESQFANEGDFSPATFDRIHDRLTIYALWLKQRVSSLFPFSFPDAAARSGKFLGFDAGGNGVLLSGTGADAALRTDLAANTGAALVKYTPKSSAPALALKGFLDRFGTWAEDRAGIQQANDYIVAQGKRDLISLPPGATITASTGLSIDGAFVGFDSRGAEIDFGAMTSGSAFRYQGSDTSPYEQNQNIQRLPRLIGPGIGSSVDGLVLDDSGNDGSGPAHLLFMVPNISGFRKGVILKNRGYLAVFEAAMIYACDTCVSQETAVDGMENNRFKGGALFNSNWAVKMADDRADLYLDGVSLDALAQIANIDSGKLTLRDCHIEEVGGTSSYTGTPFLLNGAYSRVHLLGGSRGVPSGATRNFSYWANLAAGSVFIDGMKHARSDRTLTGIFATGAGTYIREGAIDGDETRDNCWIGHETKSRVADPAFTTLGANVLWVTNPNTRYVDAATNALTVAAGELVATKNTAAGNAFQFVLAIPARRGELIGGCLKYRKPGSQAGSFNVDFAWAQFDPLPSGVIPNVAHQETYASQTITVPSSAVAATQINAQPISSQRAPEWATHFLVVVTMTAMNAGAVNFSGFNFSAVG